MEPEALSGSEFVVRRQQAVPQDLKTEGGAEWKADVEARPGLPGSSRPVSHVC